MKKILQKASVDFLIVHSTYTAARLDLTVEDVLNRRIKNGFPDIGFHHVITRDGSVELGVPLDTVGTHTPRFADSAIGILLVGGKTSRGVPSDNYTQAQKQSLKTLLTTLKLTYINAKVIGSGEVLGGSSPHFDLQEVT